MPVDIKKAIIKQYVTFKDLHENKYVSYSKALSQRLKNRKSQYKIIRENDLSEFKKSDTIFILGSGPSLNQITEREWEHIASHDSFGLNFSLLKSHIPTFYQPAYHRDELSKTHFHRFFTKCRKQYSNVVWMLSDKALNRFVHPHILPNLFPPDPIICQYSLPEPIVPEKDGQFSPESFRRTPYYRGTLSLVLHFIQKLEYKNIVLLGVDLNTWEDFFYDVPGMEEYAKIMRENAKKVNYVFETMIPKGDKSVPMDQYYYALRKYLNSHENAELYIGYDNNMLYPGLPAYFNSSIN